MAAGVFFLWTMLDFVLNARPYLGSWQDTICVGDLGVLHAVGVKGFFGFGCILMLYLYVDLRKNRRLPW